ncbi:MULTISPECIES: transcription-repair coupling factor [unclassified Lactococcus]|uniref:transcription-repair coupling factor n=1 Tax=unclassified Lactococcus TaxID=2643510 RepID=UPI0011C9D8D7|nr:MULTISPECIES: transcription-repair coupling factor [unclassified Lactococcus]MQW22668.1 transcription-repair coupling factor [Lactococcus sp. dk101]TXK44677.1 transcription-repair coupling factor [Lactococcus sp. dk310]TXK50571.1 transcription-repair coupling factor [Lactococcus sp. dk322]
MNIIEFFDGNRDIQNWQRSFSKRERHLLTGLTGTAKALVMANAYENNPDKYVIITDSQFHANELYDELSSLIDENDVYQFFSDDNVYAEFALASKDRIAYRLEALNFLLDNQKTGFLVVPFMALRSQLPSPDNYSENYLLLTSGDEYDLSELTVLLTGAGYEKTQRVMTPGEFSQRGDIFDVYPLDAENPIRVEFFGDEVDAIRSFDVESQRSLESLERLEIYPASDMILTDNEFTRGVKQLSALTENLDDNKTKSYFEELISASQNHYFHKDLRKFAEYFYEKSSSLLDYLPKGTQVFIDDFQRINEMNNKIEMELADFILSEKSMNRALDNQKYLLDTIAKVRNYKPVSFFSNFQKGLGNIKFDGLHNFNQHSMQQFFGQMELFYTEVDRYVKQQFTVVLAVPNEKLQQSLLELDLEIARTSADDIQVGKINLVNLALSNGFNFIDEKLVVITDSEIFGKVRKKKARRLNITNAERLKDYNELEVGDYVVHKNHGIGKYLGIQTIEIDGMHRDYLTIQYQNNDTISIPVDHLDMLSKYTAGEGKAPKVNKLNDGRWRRTMTSVSKQVEDISEDLIKLYAKRQSQKGYAFAPDDVSQEEFDNGFAYPETPDQLRSINEIKHDMELSRPMDRLLVGDVGFGKTEVAMRAAFKAINDGKQVAVLVPTTVLAEQHYKSMTERFVNFGVNVAVLSRFQTKVQQEEIISKLRKGQIDLIIGTHRLLSKDIEFFDLGLMIIDEEQRFGVKHKERLKALKSQVDVLTLTATPIPRTLHMSMLGIRDLSVIETPPTNRYPVQTYVMESNYGVVRDAVLREISRGGQVYYVYNRVDSIEQKVSQLEELIPEARIGFIHGQMGEVQLENTLLDFIAGDYDILVATTIIETGVDIPNANTLFIENADIMGLSQLYQLRGRVGRTNRVAYAYFMYRPEKILSEVSEKRLDAIKGFTELGSGFKIAMRDLSIRGAGNLLGAEQSGFIDSIGFDLYSQLLEEAVQKRLGHTKTRRKSNSEIALGLDAFIPGYFISDERQKIEIYKRIRQIDSRQTYEELQDEIVDRFGEYPDEVAYLLEIGLLKNFADNAMVEKIDKTKFEVIIALEKSANTMYDPQQFFEALAQTTLPATLGEAFGRMTFKFKIENRSSVVLLSEIMNFVEALSKLRDKNEIHQK